MSMYASKLDDKESKCINASNCCNLLECQKRVQNSVLSAIDNVLCTSNVAFYSLRYHFCTQINKHMDSRNVIESCIKLSQERKSKIDAVNLRQRVGFLELKEARSD